MICLPQRKTGWIAAAALFAATSLAMAEATTTPKDSASAAKPQEAAIPFANQGGIRDWRADNERGMWVQDTHNRWYYGRFMAPCTGLQFAETVRFKTGPSGELDRWSVVRARDTGNCAFTSFVRSEGPPKKAAKPPKVKTAEPASAAAPPPAPSPAPAAPATPPPS